ncbi:MAG: FAD-binding domain-containing protein [Niveispirillum sp.]|uniref:FAD-binding domain-containing protein n=1 Tax=Niveispirillum sp. TaxID=1917217 RepID=UPI004036505A
MINFPPTRAAGLDRLSRFTPRMGRTYAAGRNSDPGPGKRHAVSELSPYVRHRLVTEEELLQAAIAAHGAEAAEKFVAEVFWRTYWKGWLEMRPGIYDRYAQGLDTAMNAMAHDRSLARRVDRACEGRSGIEGFDDWAVELVETGYLHNHARMWFASIWIFTLRLPWELGADFFFRHLLDGDPASNTLSWRWVAGLHTKGKTYLARRDNIRDHTYGRFDPDGLSGVAVALEEASTPPATPIAPIPAPDRRAATGLLLHGDDVAGVGLDIGVDISALAGLIIDDGRSAMVQDWTAAALGDGVTEMGWRLGLSGSCLGLGDVLAWTRAHGLTQVLVPEAPVGPVRTALGRLSLELGRAGVKLLSLRRPYDALCWPHAGKGFFAFKEKILTLLTQVI